MTKRTFVASFGDQATPLEGEDAVIRIIREMLSDNMPLRITLSLWNGNKIEVTPAAFLTFDDFTKTARAVKAKEEAR